MNARVKPSIQMARLSDLAEQIENLSHAAQTEEDLDLLAKLRSEQARIRHNLNMEPMKVSA